MDIDMLGMCACQWKTIETKRGNWFISEREKNIFNALMKWNIESSSYIAWERSDPTEDNLESSLLNSSPVPFFEQYWMTMGGLKHA